MIKIVHFIIQTIIYFIFVLLMFFIAKKIVINSNAPIWQFVIGSTTGWAIIQGMSKFKKKNNIKE